MTNPPTPPAEAKGKTISVGTLHDRVVLALSTDGQPFAAFTPQDALMFAALVIKHAMGIATALVGKAIDEVYGPGDPSKQ